MGLLSTCLINNIHFFQCIIILCGFVNLSVCLFEDQIGKFDWLVKLSKTD